MKITRIFADANGESHFQDLDSSDLGKSGLGGNESSGKLSTLPVSALTFRETSDEKRGWHCAPKPQLVILLDGLVEVEVSDGEIRQFKAGDLLLADDTSGKGHLTKVLSSGTRRSLFVPV